MKKLLLLSLLVLLSHTAWTEPVTSPLEIFVSVPPQAYCVNAIGGKHVRVHVLVAPGKEPHSFEPTPQQMITLSKAQIYFTIGLPLEQQLMKKIKKNQRSLQIIDTSKGITRLQMESHADHKHKHHTRTLTDPHIWLDPANLKKMSQTICQTLIKNDPQHATYYTDNLTALNKLINTTDTKISTQLKPYKGRKFIVFHPAFGYFAHAYDLKQVPVELEGKSPAPRQLAQLIAFARKENIHTIFVQPQFDKRAATSIARAIKGNVVPLNPLAQNVIQNLQKMAQAIQTSFK